MADPKWVLTDPGLAIPISGWSPGLVRDELAAKLGIPGDDITVDRIETAGRTPTVQVTLRMAELVAVPFAPAPAKDEPPRGHDVLVWGPNPPGGKTSRGEVLPPGWVWCCECGARGVGLPSETAADDVAEEHAPTAAPAPAREQADPADERPRAEHPCPDCGSAVLRIDHAMDPSTYRCRDEFDCGWESETPPPDPEATEPCDDPGPRIGEGRPTCVLPAGHDGRHIAHPSWGQMVTWPQWRVDTGAASPQHEETDRG